MFPILHVRLELSNTVQEFNLNLIFMFESVFETLDFILKLFRLNTNIFHLPGCFPSLMHFRLFVLRQVFIRKVGATRTCQKCRNVHIYE